MPLAFSANSPPLPHYGKLPTVNHVLTLQLHAKWRHVSALLLDQFPHKKTIVCYLASSRLECRTALDLADSIAKASATAWHDNNKTVPTKKSLDYYSRLFPVGTESQIFFSKFPKVSQAKGPDKSSLDTVLPIHKVSYNRVLSRLKRDRECRPL